MKAARVSLVIGIGAIIYLAAMMLNGPRNIFDYSLLLVILSPLVSLLCIVGLVLATIASRKSDKAKVANQEATAGIILNAVGMVGPFVIPLLPLL